jgi:hypothetical protein
MEHRRKTDEEIKEVCQKTFVTMDRALFALWLACGLVLTGAGTVISYGFATSNSITQLKDSQTSDQGRLDRLDKDINSKLDELIKRGQDEKIQKDHNRTDTK